MCHARVTYSTDEEDVERCIEGAFSSVTVYNLSHASADFVAASERSLNDGYLSLVCMRNPGRVGLLRTMISAEVGNQAETCQWWTPIDVKKVKIETMGTSHAGLVVDGEKWNEKIVTAEILNMKLTTFTYSLLLFVNKLKHILRDEKELAFLLFSSRERGDTRKPTFYSSSAAAARRCWALRIRSITRALRCLRLSFLNLM